MKKICIYLLLLLCCILVGCNQSTIETIKDDRTITSLDFTQDNIILHLDENELLPLEYSGTGDFDSISYEYSVNDIITIDYGIIIPKKVGKTILTASSKSDSAIKDSINISIIPANVSADGSANVYLTACNKAIFMNDKVQLEIRNLETIPNATSMDDFIYTVEDPTIASIDKDYVLTGLKNGSTEVKATMKNNEAAYGTFTIYVGCQTEERNSSKEPTKGPLAMKIDSSTYTIKAGEYVPITIDGANNLLNYSFRSSDTTLARITDTGKIVGCRAGKVTVNVTSRTASLVTGYIEVIIEGVSQADYVQRIIDAGLSQEGIVEGLNNSQRYGQWYNWNNVAWCAMFVSWCSNEAGVPTDVILQYASCSTGKSWFEQKGLFKYKEDYTPKPGDVIFFLSNGASHTGLVINVDNEKVYTIEGNTSNMVAKRSYYFNHSTITGYGTPAYEGIKSNAQGNTSGATDGSDASTN